MNDDLLMTFENIVQNQAEVIENDQSLTTKQKSDKIDVLIEIIKDLKLRCEIEEIDISF